MKKATFSQAVRIVIAACFAVMLTVMSVASSGMFLTPIQKLAAGEMTFSKMTEDVAAGYQSDMFPAKNSFVTMNGLFARLTARRYYHKVMRLNNGMLLRQQPAIIAPAVTAAACQRVADFADYVKGMGIPFVYAMPALGIDLNDELILKGIDYPNNAIVSETVEALRDRGVETIDFRTRLNDTIPHIEQYYYRTDHHWNADGAFVGYQMVMEKLRQLDPSIQATHTDISQWERHTKANWFLGSNGRHVGPLYAGTDTLIWYTPKFETHMSTVIHNHKQLFAGDFEQAVIRKEYLEKLDYFGWDPYSIYFGGQFPIIRNRNLQAPNKKRVLIIKDSYILPLQALLATEFTELDVIDPRYYTATTLAEYVSWTKPDLVIMCMMHIYLPDLSEDAVYGTHQMQSASPGQVTVPLESETVEVPASAAAYNALRLPVQLENGKSYRFSVQHVDVLEGKTDGVSVLLYDEDTKGFIYDAIMVIEYLNAVGSDEFIFTVPDNGHRHVLFVYAGVMSATRDIGVRYSGVRLEKLE